MITAQAPKSPIDSPGNVFQLIHISTKTSCYNTGAPTFLSVHIHLNGEARLHTFPSMWSYFLLVHSFITFFFSGILIK